MSRRRAIPSFRLHKQSGQAVDTLTDKVAGKRKEVLLGVYDAPESHAEYTRIILKWLALGRSLPKQSDADPGKSSDLTRIAQGRASKNIAVAAVNPRHET